MLFKMLSIIAVAAILTATHVQAQVTIGSAETPLAGALLDLKEGTITTKGLAMPRVKLNSLEIPDGQTSLSSTIDGAGGDWEKDKHIGLLVYNMNNCTTSGKGLYVWGGNSWKALRPRIDKAPNTTVGTVTDHEGNVYTTALFGTKRWMTQNLRVTTNLDNTPIELIVNGNTTSTARLIAYPKSSFTDTNPPADWTEADGILYTGNAFFGHEGNSISSPPAIRRGLCPSGWHVPTGADYKELLTELKNNYQLYSYAKNGDGKGASLAANCAVYDGMSKPAALGGFDDRRVGIVRIASSAPLNVKYYDQQRSSFFLINTSDYWVSSSRPIINQGAWFYNSDFACIFCGIAGNSMASVRCVED